MKTIKIQADQQRFEISLPNLATHNKIPAPVEIYLASNDTLCEIESIEIFGNGSTESYRTETIFIDIYKNKYKLTVRQETKFSHPIAYFHSAYIEIQQEWKWIGGIINI
jgi:hypothetical protein